MNNKIILAKNIKIDKQYKNVLSYNENEMVNLCRKNAVVSSDNYSFIRHNGNIITNFSIEQCLKSNYMAFQNPNYSNKWFFAWIDDVIFKGENNTEIIYTIDAFSTFYDKWNKKTCFINRQHTNNDVIGANTILENLDVGEVIEEGVTEDLSYKNDGYFWIGVLCSWTIKNGSHKGGDQYSHVSVYNNNVFAEGIYLFKIERNSNRGFLYLSQFLGRVNGDGHIKDVKNVFIIPSIAFNEVNLTFNIAYVTSDDKFRFEFYTPNYTYNSSVFNSFINKLTSFSDYTPKNNKCFVYPFNYLFVSNNQGSNNIYKYENFEGNSCIFENQFSVSIGGSGRLVPKKYKGMITADDEALSLGKYPVCEWSSDAFTNWLTQNGVNIATSLVATGATIGTTIATAGATTPALIAAGVSVAGAVGKTIGNFNQASLLPNITGGQAVGDVIWSANRNCFTFRQMRVKTEYLKIIDDYFTRFGYAVKKLESPNLKGRKYWNYVEIGQSEEIGYGEVPSKYMEIINNAFRSGVTIWHQHENLGDYSLNNSII